MNFKKLFGWNNDKVAEIEFVVKTTRDTLKHIIAGMRVRPRDGAYLLHIMDRTGLTSRLLAESKDFGTKEKLRERYELFCQHFNLPYCCIPHEREYTGTDMDNLFDDGMDSLFDGDDMDSLFDEDEDDMDSLFDEDDEDWDISDDEDEWDIR